MSPSLKTKNKVFCLDNSYSQSKYTSSRGEINAMRFKTSFTLFGRVTVQKLEKLKEEHWLKNSNTNMPRLLWRMLMENRCNKLSWFLRGLYIKCHTSSLAYYQRKIMKNGRSWLSFSNLGWNCYENNEQQLDHILKTTNYWLPLLLSFGS